MRQMLTNESMVAQAHLELVTECPWCGQPFRAQIVRMPYQPARFVVPCPCGMVYQAELAIGAGIGG